jgi:hypothetical protein
MKPVDSSQFFQAASIVMILTNKNHSNMVLMPMSGAGERRDWVKITYRTMQGMEDIWSAD